MQTNLINYFKRMKDPGKSLPSQLNRNKIPFGIVTFFSSQNTNISEAFQIINGYVKSCFNKFSNFKVIVNEHVLNYISSFLEIKAGGCPGVNEIRSVAGVDKGGGRERERQPQGRVGGCSKSHPPPLHPTTRRQRCPIRPFSV